MRYLIILLFILSCSSMEQAGKVLRNEKTKTTDEFLIKKKEPLIMPPDVYELPEPNTKKLKKENDEEEKIKEIFKMPKSESVNTKSNSSTENLIIDKIKK